MLQGIREATKVIALFLGRSRREQTFRRNERRTQPRLTADEPGRVEWLTDDQEPLGEDINIEDISETGVGFSSPLELKVGQTVWVSTDGSPRCKAVVRHTRTGTDGYFVGVIRVPMDRRRIDRRPAGGRGRLHWGAVTGGQLEANVVVRDTSDYGLQLQIPDPVPIQCVVRVEGRAGDCFGSTCYCEPYQGEYLVGLHVIRRGKDTDIDQFNE